MLENRLVGVVGYPGAGKSTFSEYLSGLGYLHVSGSSILKEEAKALGLDYDGSRDGLMPVWHDLADIRGKDWLSQIVIEKSQVQPIVFDGIRICEDALNLKLNGAKLIHIHSSPQQVLPRLKSRGRSDDEIFKTTRDVINRNKVENNGKPFAVKKIIDLCDVSVLPIPYFTAVTGRNQYFTKLVNQIL